MGGEMKKYFSRSVISFILVILSLFSFTVASASISDGAATLIQNNRVIYSTSLSVERRLHLNEVKVNFSVTAMVKPSAVHSQLALFKSLHLPSGVGLDVISFNQRKAEAGLINIQVKLTGVLPVDQLQAAYELAEKNNQSGRVFRVDSVIPYFPLSKQRMVNQQLSLQLYEQANVLAKVLSKGASHGFKVAQIEILPGPQSTSARFRAVNLVAGVDGDVSALPMLRTVVLSARVTLVSA